MKPILSRAQMRAFDAHAIQTCRVPSLVLMENAGRGATDVLCEAVLGGHVQNARITIVCGTGNNGGDGFVIARHLRVRGARPRVLLCGAKNKVTGDARANLDALEGVGVSVKQDATAEDVGDPRDTDVVVDALFGTGLDRPIDGPLADIVRALNALRLPMLAVDLPSGVDADTGQPLGVAVQAAHTVTFAHPKLGLLTPEGARASGKLHVVDIGVPAHLVEKVGAAAHLVEEGDIAPLIEPRAVDVHKFRAGHVGIVAGAPGKLGAALLVAHSALRAGAGAATIASFPEALPALAGRVLEVMTAEIEPGAVGPSLDRFLANKRAVVVGPGFGTGDRARSAIVHVVATWRGPLVLDADALTAYAGRANLLTASSAGLVLTPHSGEAARLLGSSAGEVERDRYAAARELASITNATVLLKGPFTIIAHPTEGLFVNPTGAPTLATAGSGDVLAGLVAAFACALPPRAAAMAAAFVHGLTGEDWPTDRGLLAHEMADRVPAVLGALATAHTQRATGHTHS
jgi:NAD(P)H-hydrate epimerase